MSDVDDLQIARQKLATAPLVELVVAVGPNAAGGSRWGQETLWTMSFNCCAWRPPGSDLRTDDLYIFRPMPYEEIAAWTDQVQADGILRIRARLGVVEFTNGPRAEAYLEEIVGPVDDDEELNDLIEELNVPIVHFDSQLGELMCDRQFGWFEGEAEWNGAAVTVNLAVETPAALDEVLKTAHALWNNQADWSRRVNEFAVQQLLPLKNDNWLGEDEEPLTAEEFVGRMTLTTIEIGPDTELTFWHDDGNLFWGHAIQIDGDLKTGLSHADIPG